VSDAIDDPLGSNAFENFFLSTVDFKTYDKDKEFMALALEDAYKIDTLVASLLLGNVPSEGIISIPGGGELTSESYINAEIKPTLWAFRGRLLGKDSPHNKLPMPCFDFVKEIWGDAWVTSYGVASDIQNKEQIDLLTAQYNQNAVEAHTLFIVQSTWGTSRKPLLGDTWSVRLQKGAGKNTYNLETATALGFENDLIKNQNWKKSNSTTDVYYTTAKEGCDSLLDLFEEEYIAALPIINLEEGECKIETSDWPSWTKDKSNYMWTQLSPGTPHALTVKPCENYVVVGKNYPALKDIVKKEIDWWACGDVKKAWGTKMDSGSLAEFNTEPTVDGVKGWYADRSTNCSGSVTGCPSCRGDTQRSGGPAEKARIKEYYEVAYENWKGNKPPTSATDNFEPENWVNAGKPWSAVTISWLLLKVDPEFPSGTGHFHYMFRSAGVEPTFTSPTTPYEFPSDTSKKGDWTIWLRGKTATRIMAQIGDILVKPRGDTSLLHSDVVSRIAKDGDKTYAYLAGGNISDTMYGWRKDSSIGGRIELTSTGTYSEASSGEDYQIVLKKNGVIVEDTTALVAQVKDEPDEIVVA